jgi:hypothetical protein
MSRPDGSAARPSAVSMITAVKSRYRRDRARQSQHHILLTYNFV